MDFLEAYEISKACMEDRDLLNDQTSQSPSLHLKINFRNFRSRSEPISNFGPAD